MSTTSLVQPTPCTERSTGQVFEFIAECGSDQCGDLQHGTRAVGTLRHKHPIPGAFLVLFASLETLTIFQELCFRDFRRWVPHELVAQLCIWLWSFFFGYLEEKMTKGRVMANSNSQSTGNKLGRLRIRVGHGRTIAKCATEWPNSWGYTPSKVPAET